MGDEQEASKSLGQLARGRTKPSATLIQLLEMKGINQVSQP